MHSDRIRQALYDIRDNAVLAEGDAPRRAGGEDAGDEK